METAAELKIWACTLSMLEIIGLDDNCIITNSNEL